MAYQWIITFTTTSTTLPVPPGHSTIASMLGKLFTSPNNIWLAGPQSVDDSPTEQVSGPTQVVYQWMISLQTVSNIGPTIPALRAELIGTFGSTVDNVWLAGPQSVDDGPAEESKERG